MKDVNILSYQIIIPSDVAPLRAPVIPTLRIIDEDTAEIYVKYPYSTYVSGNINIDLDIGNTSIKVDSVKINKLISFLEGNSEFDYSII